MSDDLVSDLRQQARNRAERMGGGYEATVEWRAAAEIERLRESAKGQLVIVNAAIAGKTNAESELSTLRARVREVVGPFGKIDPFEAAFSKHGKIFRLDYNASLLDQLTFEHFRAARQLMEEVK